MARGGTVSAQRRATGRRATERGPSGLPGWL